MFSRELLQAVLKIGLMLGGIMTGAAYFVLLERRVAAWVQDRRGPNRVGAPLSILNKSWKDFSLFGLGQPAADGLKMILKEEYTPGHVDQRLFLLAPLVIMSAALSVFAVIPFGGNLPPIPLLGFNEPIETVVAPGLDVGVIYIFALSSIAVYGVILGGWASNNKYSFLGGLRSSAQMISYEIPLGLGLLGVVFAVGSLRLSDIIAYQATTGFWFALAQPLGFIVFVVAAFAEAGRLPFDLPEAEQELIGGYHTEYAGMKLVLFLTAEFIHMITASFLIVILFLGGWHMWGMPTEANPTLNGELSWTIALARIGILMTKTFCVIFFFMMVRWSWPRFRFDQLMSLAWKVMLPLGLVNLIAVAILFELQHRDMLGAWFDATFGSWTSAFVAVVGWVVGIVAVLVAATIGPMVTDNRPKQRTRHFAVDDQI